MKIKKMFLISVAAIVLLLAVLTCVTPSGSWSYYEKRALAAKPLLSCTDVFSGKAAEQTENYLSDRLYARQQMLRLRAKLLSYLGKPVINSVVTTKQALVPAALRKTVSDRQSDTADRIAKGLSEVQKQTRRFGGEFLYVLVPEQRSALREVYPAEMENDGAYLDACAELLLQKLDEYGVSYLDMRQKLCENALENYYKTDHHYSLTGAYVTYEAICEKFGLTPCEITVEKTQAQLLGTYACKLFATNRVTDFYEIYEPSVKFRRIDNGKISVKPLFREPEGTVMYDAYMGGDLGETVLKTDRYELPNLLLVGNSFTNALEAIAYQSFNDLRSLDFRHYGQSSLTEYIALYRPQYTVVICDDQSCLTTSDNNLLQ